MTDKKEYDRKRYEDNKEEMKAQRRQYYIINKEKIKARSKQYRVDNKAKVDAFGKKWRESNKDKTKEYQLKRHYGMTLEGYNSMLEKQDGKCAICNKYQLGRALSVDHNHDTGEIRGLLCQRCNRAIGLFDEDIKNLINAIEYIKQHSKEK